MMPSSRRDLPTSGYAILVDGRVKTEFASREGVEVGARDLKRRSPNLQVKIYDARAGHRCRPWQLLLAITPAANAPAGIADRDLQPELIEFGLQEIVRDDQRLHRRPGVAAAGRNGLVGGHVQISRVKRGRARGLPLARPARLRRISRKCSGLVGTGPPRSS